MAAAASIVIFRMIRPFVRLANRRLPATIAADTASWVQSGRDKGHSAVNSRRNVEDRERLRDTPLLGWRASAQVCPELGKFLMQRNDERRSVTLRLGVVAERA
jgi:hypothetical protein